jgi:DsbC/DsbD-like thiol-disulfide interchange protein
MTCSPTTLQLAVGESTELTIKLAMTKNWHVNSNAPGNEYAIPLSFKVLNDNVTLETSWPTGKTMISAGESVDVYSDKVSIPIVVTAHKGAKGPIQLMVTWQACDAESCLAQETNQVPCEITVK